MSNTGNAPSAKDQLRLHALQTALADMLVKKSGIEVWIDGKECTCPGRVGRDNLTKRATEHLRHIHADVRGDKEGCDEKTGRGPKCDIHFKAKRDKGAMGPICGDCGSVAEMVSGTERCPECDTEASATNPVIACTQQQCRSKGKVACRQCCVQLFQERHYHQHAYQP